MIRNDLTAPSTTITSATIGGAIGTLFCGWLARRGIVLTPAEAGSVVTIFSGVAGYAVRERRYRWTARDEGGGP